MQKLEMLLSRVQKPARYIGGEQNSVIKEKSADLVRFAFCFPDSYEVGMSNLGMKILYHSMNERSEIWCERVFAPWSDMEREMRAEKMPLYALESKDAVKEFDFIGFTLQTELSYTNILNMLDLAEIPLRSSQRGNDFPIVVAGGSCAYNPEPLADFIDLFILGEGEEINTSLCLLWAKVRGSGGDKAQFLREAVALDGVYVPSFYDVSYFDDGKLKTFTPKFDFVPAKVKKCIISDLSNVSFPDKFILPFCEIVHDRAMLELFRGCIRGCRFCQAGFIYRPIRSKSAEVLNEQAKKLIDGTGYDEISMLSLSTSDYKELESLTDSLMSWCEPRKVSLSLPSLRVDNFSTDLLNRVQKVRKGGLTFAPEAGTQRLRDVINKNITEEQLINTSKIAFSGGWSTIKLYFMIGLPTETDEDILGIAELAEKIAGLSYLVHGKRCNISVSVSSFIPKPFTPFQWEPQDEPCELERKQKLLRGAVKSRKISLHWHDKRVSLMEAVFARGDRRLCDVLEYAMRSGCKFDNWEDFFDYNRWISAFEACKVDPTFYTTRKREYDELLPWNFIDIGVRDEFFVGEAELAKTATTTINCREGCSGCGANRLNGGSCDD